MLYEFNAIELSQMTVGVEGLLYRILNKREVPFDFDESLNSGISFLEEAQKGGEIMCRKQVKGDFIGTLFPFKISTKMYLKYKSGKGTNFYENITESLKSYKNLLENIKIKKTIAKTEKSIAEETHNFFEFFKDWSMFQIQN
ncbi:hypothetical protein KAJ87_00510 [Candidatus Pacearchaeota archaeon]|nr:hypothetical protein [Candidatus Pacearchaeota archaeon]